MIKTMGVKQFVETAEKIATEYKTLYVMGCFGAPMSARNKKRYSNNNDFNRQPERQEMINNASSDTFGFDCVCLIKGILWGWNGDANLIYGGAQYPTKQMVKDGWCPDFSPEGMLDYCTDVSDDFSNIEVGEVVYLEGHVGIYKGDGKVVEATVSWENKVQIIELSARKWLKHGKLMYVDYEVMPEPIPVEPTPGDPEVKPEEPIPEPVPTPKFKVGDRVKIVGTGNANSYGTGHRAGGIGWHRYITKIYEGRAYPYQVGIKGKTDGLNTTGFYKEDALEIAN